MVPRRLGRRSEQHQGRLLQDTPERPLLRHDTQGQESRHHGIAHLQGAQGSEEHRLPETRHDLAGSGRDAEGESLPGEAMVHQHRSQPEIRKEHRDRHPVRAELLGDSGMMTRYNI